MVFDVVVYAKTKSARGDNSKLKDEHEHQSHNKNQNAFDTMFIEKNKV